MVVKFLAHYLLATGGIVSHLGRVRVMRKEGAFQIVSAGSYRDSLCLIYVPLLFLL